MSNLPAPGTYSIDASHSHVGFAVKHFGLSKVKGEFTDFSGTLTIAEDPAASAVEVTIAAASFNSRDEGRDTHIRSADFLDVEQFPTISFTSKAVTQKDDDEFIVTGDLTIHGVTKPVDVKFELLGTSQDPWGGTRIGFEGKAEISRKEFGLVWNVALETGGVLVSDTIKLELDVEAVKK